ncbi:ATP dependent RNA helicase, putative [Talaromyces stipitatus ATCC 10500]|uniref:RNA helicase n=1 Tax=Talaromyces stipitatus (strain ATCC 10500 / CBS 375.48 / QM 6759 / NRRL 1006) TaxID=441959 RepID=B8LYR4_TALSN|nr:ATP dependent RNA helicase, putative [Talaromyces stipitatus ATCC 10500]EED23422.1 ATP dependent RNA helicase, putative [Talaromyces stipitatus ATCC 10500]
MGMKRGRESRNLAKKASKKQRVEDTVDNAEGIVGIDDLNWQTVQLPDRLGDIGGFFGLEEIDGVDIIKPESSGQIKFKVAADKPTKSILKKTEHADETPNDNIEEWSGFSDGEEQEVEAQKKQKTKKKSEYAKQKNPADEKKPAAKKEQRQPNAKGGKPDEKIQSLPFTALDEEVEDEVDVSAWDSLGLSPALQTSLSKLKFSTPSTIQQAVIPEVLAGHDVVGKASTGSGKTLAFGIPILEYYLGTRGQHGTPKEKKKKESQPIALILSPTRELAHQLAKHIGTLNSHTPAANARIALLTGGLAIQKQQRLLADADIVIGTPGRVWEILSSGTGLIQRMSRVKYLVLDEADRLLSDGHYKELEEILDALDRKEDNEEAEDSPSESEEDEEKEDATVARQTLVFSATFHKGLQQKLSGKGKFMSSDLMNKSESMEYLLRKLKFREEKPKFIDVNPISQMAQGLKEGILECGAIQKDLYLYTLLLYHPNHRCLVFANSISSVRRLSQLLQNLGIPALALHSSMEQKARLRSVERFSSPDADPSSVLVATDVAARGLDIKGIDMVIHYHVPRTADMYVHRSGRTARAGASGKSVLICAPDEVVGVARLVGKVHAQAEAGAPTKRNPLESLELDRRVVSRVKPRMTLAKKITESTLAKEKISSEDNWLRNAAEELGVDYDSEEFEKQGGKAKGRGRGGGRLQKEKEAGSITKAEMAGLRAELKQLLSKRINIGISERYITAGRVNVESLLRGEGNNKAFIGLVDKLEF